MNDVPVKNNTNSPLWVGPTMVPPNETRLIPAHHVPEYLRPKPIVAEPEPVADRVTALLDLKVADIVEAFPRLDDDELGRLKVAEEAGNTRKTLMEAIGEEELRRAHVAELRKQLVSLDDLTLANHLANLPESSDEAPVAQAILRERLASLDVQALQAKRAVVEKIPAALAIVDEVLAARVAATVTK